MSDETAPDARQTAVIDDVAAITNLTVMQRQFLVHYLLHGNATQAAEAAGYAHPGKQGSRLRRSRRITAAINEYFRAQELGAAEMVARLSQQARAGYADYLEPDGSVDLAGLLAAGLGHLVKGVRETKYGRQIEFYDAQTALVQIGRYHGLFTDRVDHTSDGEPLRIEIRYADADGHAT